MLVGKSKYSHRTDKIYYYTDVEIEFIALKNRQPFYQQYKCRVVFLDGDTRNSLKALA